MHQPGLISAQSCQNGPTYLAAPPGAPLSHGSNAIACVLATKPSCVPTLSRGGALEEVAAQGLWLLPNSAGF